MENASIGWRPTFTGFLNKIVCWSASKLWDFQTYAWCARYEGLASVLVHGRPCSPHPELWKTSQSCGSTFGHAPSLEVHRCCREARYYVQQTCKMIHMFSLSKDPCLDSVDLFSNHSRLWMMRHNNFKAFSGQFLFNSISDYLYL